VIRHADAGYDEAIAAARERGVRVPKLELESAEPARDPYR
jgi:urocanate hydratase